MVRIPIPFLKLTRCAPIAVPLSVSTVIFAYIRTHVTAQTPSSGHPYASTYTFLCASYQTVVPCALPISQQYLVRFLSASSTLCGSYQPTVPCALPISQKYLVCFLSANSTLCGSYQSTVPCALPISQHYPYSNLYRYNKRLQHRKLIREAPESRVEIIYCPRVSVLTNKRGQ